jgi:hypothetical protein
LRCGLVLPRAERRCRAYFWRLGRREGCIWFGSEELISYPKEKGWRTNIEIFSFYDILLNGSSYSLSY